LYQLELKSSVKKDFKHIDIADVKIIKESLYLFVENFSFEYEQELLKTGKIKKMQGFSEELYRLKLRQYRVIYTKENDKLIILVLSIKSRENSYKNK
jgi:mRNA interferase RelE/StbE